jgi:hypothetical protein
MHGHLATLKADLVKAARTRLLAFMATARCFAQTRTNTTADTALGML